MYDCLGTNKGYELELLQILLFLGLLIDNIGGNLAGLYPLHNLNFNFTLMHHENQIVTINS